MQNIPSEGTITRCPHGCYAPGGDAYHCEACHPIRPGDKDQRPVHVPHVHRQDNGGLFANANAPACCPKCRSRVHVVEKNGKWTCADCGKTFKPPKNMCLLSRELREELAAA